MPAAPALVAATVDHLARFAPFDAMSPEDLAWLAERLKLGYYAKGEVVLSPRHGEVDRLFIIKQGVVQGEQAAKGGAWLELHEGESFPLGALLSKRPAISTFRAQTDVFATSWQRRTSTPCSSARPLSTTSARVASPRSSRNRRRACRPNTPPR